ncbi:MAG: hypothetical protein M1576_03750 [Deltaproteobacteria bacterium]|nr:hypothetical protein [Deltaproteobacteria bacterium]
METLLEIDLSRILKPYAKKDLWVALYPDYKKIAGYGKTLKDALNEAKKNNVNKPFIIKAFSDYSGFAPTNK